MARAMRWTRALGVPMSEGGMPICSKHEFIESNLGDADMEYEMSKAVSAASKDGQNMEDALKERKEQIEEANSEIECMEREIRRIRIAHLRRMVSSIPGAIERTQWFPAYTEQEFEHKKWRRRDRFTRFAKACNAEIARLRGEG